MAYQRALEGQIRQSQKLDGIGRLAAGIARDSHNLVMTVLGHASELQEQGVQSDRAHDPVVAALAEAAAQARRFMHG